MSDHQKAMNEPRSDHVQPQRLSDDTLPLHFESLISSLAEVAPLANPAQLLPFFANVDAHSLQAVGWELVKLDLTEAIQAGFDRMIEDYCDALPHILSCHHVPIDLVLEEQLARRNCGQEFDLDEYHLRFPHLAAVLDRLHSTIAPAVPAPHSFPFGSQIDEFEIIRKLGAGAFATVFLARQRTMQRLVALKLASRVGDEPRALARLDHPNIVRVYDQRTRNSEPYELVYMEYLPGGTLADLVASLEPNRRAFWSGRTLTEHVDRQLLASEQIAPENSPVRSWLSAADWSSTVAWFGYQLAQALDVAHRREVLHRDIKPANVLLSAEATPKLADFNVSLARGEDNADADKNFGGSLAYMSPEQLMATDPQHQTSAEDLDGRSDLYSLGIMLWELWQGHRPWPASGASRSLAEATALQLAQRREPLSLPVENSATGRALGQVLRRTLQFDPAQRPATGTELAGQLRLALHPESAPMFHPEPGNARACLLRLPVWLVTGLLILVPNIAAGFYNFHYNKKYILLPYPSMHDTFMTLVKVVNAIAYPLGVLLLLYFTRRIAEGVRRAKEGRPATEESLFAAWQLGIWAAWIGGGLWTVAGVVYPAVLKACHPEFAWGDAFHFFGSLVLCGAIAWTFPFFGGSAAGVLLYYPAMVAPTMRDAKFEQRRRKLQKHGGRYLLAAAMVPLLTAALVAENRFALYSTIAATAVGVMFSFFAYQRFEEAFGRLAVAVEK